MSLTSYQNQVNKYLKDISDLRSKLSKEIENRSKIIKKISDLNRGISSTKSASTLNSKINELSRREKEYSTIERKISEFESKIVQKNKDLDRYSNYLSREQKKISEREDREQKARLQTLKSINSELQKKSVLEKKLGLDSSDVEEEIFVLKGDIKSFSKFMEDEFLSLYIPENFELIVKKNALDCFYYKISNGDSLVILERNLKKLVKTAKRITEDLNELQGEPKIRFAIDFGSITYSTVDGYVTKIKTSSPLRISARLEPFVTPNEIWVTENVIQSPQSQEISFVEIESGDIEMENVDGTFNIKKEGSSEDDILMKLYKI